MENMLAIYCRTSRKESISGIETIEQQREAGIKFAQNNLLNYIIYEDSGKSGYIEKSKEDPFLNRPAFKKMLEDIEAGKINQVWVWEVSRLARRNKYYASVIDTLAEKNIILNVLNQSLDLSESMQRAMVEMQGVWAQVERNEIVARTSRGKAAATDRGNLRHQALYGYETINKITLPKKDELEIVKQVFKDYLNGLNLREIARKYFTDSPEVDKLLSKVKKVQMILSHEEYTGQNLKIAGREIEKDFESEKIGDIQELLKNEYWVDNNFYKEKIIDRETWVKAKEKLEWTRRSLKKTKSQKSRETNRSLLSSILKCGTCGHNYYYKDLGQKHGGVCYQHLRTVEKCHQKPSQIKLEKLDTIIDVFFTFYYLIFDNTEDQLRQLKLQKKQSSEQIKTDIKNLEKEKNQEQRFIEEVNLKISEGVFREKTDAFLKTIELLTDKERIIEKINTEIKLKNLELEEARKQESELSRNEKYHLGTIERIQKWFDLRENNSFTELRIMLRDILFNGGIIINENYISIISGDPGRQFYFDINNDYKIIYPFIEKVINRNLNKNYSEFEVLWIEKQAEKLETFGERVNSFIKERPDRNPEESFNNNDFLFLTDCFNVKYENFGLGLYTEDEDKLLLEKYYSTKEVSEMLSKHLSTLRSWANENNVKTCYVRGTKKLCWSENDIERYKKATRNT